MVKSCLEEKRGRRYQVENGSRKEKSEKKKEGQKKKEKEERQGKKKEKERKEKWMEIFFFKKGEKEAEENLWWNDEGRICSKRSIEVERNERKSKNENEKITIKI